MDNKKSFCRIKVPLYQAAITSLFTEFCQGKTNHHYLHAYQCIINVTSGVVVLVCVFFSKH